MQLPSFIQDFLSRLGITPGSSPSVIGLDFGSSSIKVVQIKKKGGRAVLETYGEIALGPYAGTEVGRATNLPAEKIVEATKDLLREANVTTSSGASALPLSASMVSLVEMPVLEESKMKDMVPIEARRYIPIPISEVTLDWWIIPKEEEGGTDTSSSASGKTDVLLVAILNEALKKYQTISQDLALQNSFFEIEIFSTVRATLDQGIKPVMVIDFGASSTKLYLVEHGIIKDSHIINRGSQDITLAISQALGIPVQRAEEMKRSVGISADPANKQMGETINLILDTIFSEANRILVSFEKRFNKPVSLVVLSGGGAAMKGFVEASKTHFAVDVVLADPFAKLVTPPFLAPVLKSVGPEFSVAVGIALRKLNQSE